MFLLALVASTALYGVLSLIVCVFGLDIGLTTMLEAAAQPVGATGWFYAFMTRSLVAYPILVLIHVPLVKARMMRRKWSPYNGPLVFQVPSWILADLTSPFRGLLALNGMAKVIDVTGSRWAVAWGGQILHLVWALALWAWLAIGFTILVP